MLGRISTIGLLIFAARFVQAAVTVSEDTITLKTWSESAPDTNAWFELFPSYNYPVYPYTLRNNFGASTADVAWRELTIENEYLFCRVFPDLGGHLYSCRDKINNVEMFYANPVVRKGYVGLRGAWVAMGIELNFPVGHSLVAVSPVSFGTQQNADGSAGVWVADIDRQTGMEWRVEFVLRPNSALLEEDVWLYNRGDVRQPYYWWSNAEESIADLNDSFSWPAHLIATHGFTFIDTWPVAQAGILGQPGVDLSVIKNYTQQVGLFAYGSNEPFFAAYHPAAKTATAHYADPVAMPGKKLWAWGPGQYGDPWVIANLTEGFPSYIETQAGATPNQETRLWLDPQQSSHFTEYWMPARELDGVTRANTSGVLYLGRTTVAGALALSIEFNANQPLSGATIRVRNGAAVVWPPSPSPVNLTPIVTYKQTVPILDAGVNYTFELLDSTGQVLLTHTENQLSGLGASGVTLGDQPAPNLNAAGSEQDFLFRTSYHEQYQQYSAAEADYNLGLELFPTSTALLKGLGRLMYLTAQYSDAATLLAQVIARTPTDNEAHYYLGLSYSAMGRINGAASEWSAIQSSADFGPAATFQLACLRARSGDPASAAALLAGLSTARAAGLEIAVLRHQGNLANAHTILAQRRTADPTDLFLRYEGTLLDVPDAQLQSDLGAEPERVLNLADDYLSLGFYGDALTLLNQVYPDVPSNQREPGSVTPQNNALIAYYRGYSRRQLGISPAADFAAASAMPVQYIFPSRTSSFAVLGAAIQSNPNDGTAHFLLGLLYMDRRQVDNAINEWQTARSLNKRLTGLHRDLGRALLDPKNDPASALPVLSEGLTYDPSNPDLQDAYNRALAAVNSSCSFSISGPTAVSLRSGSAAINVSFTGPSTCAWTASSYAGWITSTSAVGGNGNGAVTYAVRANDGLASRTQTLLIAGNPFVVTQAGTSCTTSLTMQSASSPAAGSTFVIGVVTPSSSCIWSASTTQNWISILSGAAGDGGTVTLAVAPNTGFARNGTVTIAGQMFTVSQAGVPRRLPTDFDGNGNADLIWQNLSTGQVVVDYYGGPAGIAVLGWTWLYSGTVPDWRVVATADFNGDGVPDLVWQNEGTRQVVVHYYGGPGGAVDGGYNWMYQGTGGLGWHVVAAADFNGDGVPDLVWQNDTTRQVVVHYYGGLGGATDLAWNWLYPGLGASGWHVVSAADFNQDGVPDLVWQNDTTRQVTVHYYGGPGGTLDQGWNWLNSTGASNWKVIFASDVDGNGVPDLVWQNVATGQVTVNYYGGSGGAVYMGWNWLYTGNVEGWSLVP